MIAILNSLSFRLHISVSSGLNSEYLSFSLWSGDSIKFFMLLEEVAWILCILILFGCSYCLSPLGGGQEPRILSPPPSADIPGNGVGMGWVGGGALSPACSPGFLYLLSLSGLLGCWLDEVTPPPHKSSPPNWGLHSRLHGPLGVFTVSTNERPLPHSFPHGASCGCRSQSLGQGVKFSLTLFQLLRGGLQPLCPLSFGWVCL